MSTDLQSPLPADWPVVRARDAYLEENAFTTAAYDEPYTDAVFFGITFKVPNTPRHRWAIRLHDLHHVATGYGTDPVGEGEISAWELRRGLRELGLYVGGIVVFGTCMGLLLAPRRTLAAYRASGRGKRSLFQAELADEHDYAALLETSVGELRARLEVPRDGLFRGERRLHGGAPRAPA